MSNTSIVTVDESLLKIYRENYKDGAENLNSAMLPILKIIQKDPEEVETNDGSPAVIGQFYHTSSKKVYDNPRVSILYFDSHRLPVYNPGNKPELAGKTQFVTLVIGYLIDDRLPFLMYVKGKSLGGFFEWQKEMTRCHEGLKLPMYAFINTLSSELQKNDFGKFYTLKLEVAKNKGKYDVVTDGELADTLNNNIETAKKAVKVAVEVAGGKLSDDTMQAIDKQTPQLNESVDIDDIPV